MVKINVRWPRSCGVAKLSTRFQNRVYIHLIKSCTTITQCTTFVVCNFVLYYFVVSVLKMSRSIPNNNRNWSQEQKDRFHRFNLRHIWDTVIPWWLSKPWWPHSIGTLGPISSLLSATLYQEQHIGIHIIRNIVYTL